MSSRPSQRGSKYPSWRDSSRAASALLPSVLHPRGVFYGWWIVLAAITIEMLVSAVFIQAYGAYVVLLRDEFGWSVTILSLGFGFARVEHGLLGPLQGVLVDRYGPRRIVTAGVLVLAIGLWLFSGIRSLETFAASVF